MLAQRIFLFILGFFTLLIGSFFTWIMAQSYLNARETRTWTSVPAKLTVAEIDNRQIGEHVPVDYAVKVRYSYAFEGEKYESGLLTPRGQKWAKEREKAEYELRDLKAGQRTECWVNPQDPKIAILRHDTKAAGYSIWFPLLFVIGGGGVMIGAFRKKERSE